MPEHFAVAPNWEYWIILYFFFGGIAGGSYAIGTLIRLFGGEADRPASRIAYLVSFVALIPCPIFLIVDLGNPPRFVNMLLDASNGGLAFKYWTPMSVGSWALFVFGIFSFVSFLGALGEGGLSALRPAASVLRGSAGAAWGVVGTFFAFFVAGYTGVLLSVSNQPVWSDAGWVLGGMFLASALTGSAALLVLLAGRRRGADAGTMRRLEAADRNFALLETILIVLFLALVAVAGALTKLLGLWLLLWAVVALGLVASLVLTRVRGLGLASPVLALLGVLALRAVVIFAAQF